MKGMKKSIQIGEKTIELDPDTEMVVSVGALVQILDIFTTQAEQLVEVKRIGEDLVEMPQEAQQNFMVSVVMGVKTVTDLLPREVRKAFRKLVKDSTGLDLGR